MATNRAELRRALDELRGALGVLDSDLALDDAPQAAVQDLAQAVTGIRGSVWEFLKAEHADDYDRYLGKIQLRRAIEILEDVLSDLYADTLAPNTPGFTSVSVGAPGILQSPSGEQGMSGGIRGQDRR